MDEQGKIFLRAAMITAQSKKNYTRQAKLAKKVYLDPSTSTEEKARAFLLIGFFAIADDFRKAMRWTT